MTIQPVCAHFCARARRRVSNRAFPRMDPEAIPAFEAWGGPSWIPGAMGIAGIGIRAQMRLKNGKTRETRLNAILFWPRAQPKRTHRQPQAISDRPRGRPRWCAKKKRGSTTFRGAPNRSPTTCGAIRDVGTPLHKNWCGQYGGYAPSPADNFKRSKSWKSLHRDAGRIESFEGAPARNHGAGDRRGVIVDDFRHCSGPNGSHKRHRRGFQPDVAL